MFLLFQLFEDLQNLIPKPSSPNPGSWDPDPPRPQAGPERPLGYWGMPRDEPSGPGPRKDALPMPSVFWPSPCPGECLAPNQPPALALTPKPRVQTSLRQPWPWPRPRPQPLWNRKVRPTTYRSLNILTILLHKTSPSLVLFPVHSPCNTEWEKYSDTKLNLREKCGNNTVHHKH